MATMPLTPERNAHAANVRVLPAVNRLTDARNGLSPVLGTAGAIVPGEKKQPIGTWTERQGLTGLQGSAAQWRDARNVGLLPRIGIAILENDDPTLLPLFLAAAPILAQTAGWIRTAPRPEDQHGGWIVESDKLRNVSLKTADGKHERASLRTQGRYQVLHGDHWDKPSQAYDGEHYIFNGCPVVKLPDAQATALLALFGVYPTAPTSNKLLDFKHRLPAVDEDFDKTSYALYLLDPDMSEEKWVFVGMGLHCTFGQAGVDLWDAWSSRGTKYKPGEPQSKAKYFKSSGKTFKYVLKLAYDVNRDWQKDWYAQKRGDRQKSAPAEIVTRRDRDLVEPIDTTPLEPVDTRPAATTVVVEPQNLAADSQTDNFITPKVTLGDMVRRLNSEPKQAVIDLPRSETRSERSARRDRAAKFINSNTSPVGGNRTVRLAADSQFPALWIRNVFPQDDKLTALIPARLLNSELFADALTSDEIDNLGDLPFMVELTARQRKDVEYRIGLLKLIRRRVNELNRVPFAMEDGLTFDKVADLRAEVLRQIIAYYSTDQATGEITDCGLSNTIQACLIGTTTGALPSVRRRGGIEQTPQAVKEKAIISAQQMPSNAYSTFTRSGQLYAKVQPVSRQRVGDRPEPKPRAQRREKIIDNNSSSDISELPTTTQDWEPVPTPPTPRRPWREVYAARLMRNLLHHAQVEADESEPLDGLAEKLRNLITPIEPPASENLTTPNPLPDVAQYLIDLGGHLDSIEVTA